MNEKCNDCALAPRVEALEEANKEHGRRLGKLETATAVQDTKLDTIDDKLDSLTTMVQTLTNKINKVEHKPAQRFEWLSDKVLWFVLEAILIVVAIKVGLR